MNSLASQARPNSRAALDDVANRWQHIEVENAALFQQCPKQLMPPAFLNRGSFSSRRRSRRLNAEEQSTVFLRSWSCNQKDIPFDGGTTEENITCKS
jgi:hypothetical protein